MKSANCLWKGSELSASMYLISEAPGEPKPSSGLHMHCSHSTNWHTDTHIYTQQKMKVQTFWKQH